MLNPIEEAKFKKLRDDCRVLGVPSPPEIHIGLKVRDRNGVLTFDDKQRGHSFTRNFYNFTMSQLTEIDCDGQTLFAAGYMSGKRTGGTIDGVAAKLWYRGNDILAAGYHNNTTTAAYGIVVGTGSTAFSAEDFDLVAAIAAGTGAGQLSHVAMELPTSAYVAGTKVWTNTITRLFNNNSSGAITVAETGLMWKGYGPTGAADVGHLFERSVLSPTVEVGIGAQLTVTYDISMDFSAID